MNVYARMLCDACVQMDKCRGVRLLTAGLSIMPGLSTIIISCNLMSARTYTQGVYSLRPAATRAHPPLRVPTRLFTNPTDRLRESGRSALAWESGRSALTWEGEKCIEIGVGETCARTLSSK